MLIEAMIVKAQMAYHSPASIQYGPRLIAIMNVAMMLVVSNSIPRKKRLNMFIDLLIIYKLLWFVGYYIKYFLIS